MSFGNAQGSKLLCYSKSRLEFFVEKGFRSLFLKVLGLSTRCEDTRPAWAWSHRSDRAQSAFCSTTNNPKQTKIRNTFLGIYRLSSIACYSTRTFKSFAKRLTSTFTGRPVTEKKQKSSLHSPIPFLPLCLLIGTNNPGWLVPKSKTSFKIEAEVGSTGVILLRG